MAVRALYQPSRLQLQIFVDRVDGQIFGSAKDGLDAILAEF